MYSPYRLYAYCYAPGLGLPPYRGRTVRGTVRFNPRRSHLDFWPARPGRTVRGAVRSNPKRSYLDSFRLFWKSRGKSTRGVRPPGPQGTRGVTTGRRTARAMWSLAVAACNCFCVWLLRIGLCGGSGSLLIRGQLLLYLRGCSNLSAPLAKGGCQRS